ncbi:MAG TPA: GNAT family N-acetyltransferase [Urbifossiella sp.]|nr:GNAT family N-acetyltransferase [Urbifossiella sp.]
MTDPAIRAAGLLYERTLDPDERIPWEWIERGITTGSARTVGWRRHLILAAPGGRAARPDQLAGYAYGSFIPGYGGYLCYLGVDEASRGGGVGRQLFEAFFEGVTADAAAAGEPLPFVVWESYRPEPDELPAVHANWAARVRLFDKVGGLWVKGVDFLTPSFAAEAADPVPLQLFVKPMGRPASAFTAEKLLGVVEGLYERVYRIDPGDSLFDRTLTPDCRPKLVPAREAGATPEAVAA